LVTPVPLSPLLLLCCAYGGGSIKISLQAMPYITLMYSAIKFSLFSYFLITIETKAAYDYIPLTVTNWILDRPPRKVSIA
jgi:hypothetical protein